MAYIKEYWENKEHRAEKARKHTQEMQRKFPEDIKEAIRDTKVYSPGFVCKKQTNDELKKILIKKSEIVVAILEEMTYNENRAVLNFASYKNPGGRFIDGSKAQEECLCHESFLYNVLREFSEYYAWNHKNLNKALYKNRALYTPRVRFDREERHVFCDVITCAAPNYTAAKKYCDVTNEENMAALRERIRFVLEIAKDNRVQTLLLGAFGCGVFGQDGTMVARIFKELLENEYKCFKKVVFAIPEGKDGNYEKFCKVFT